MFSIIDECRVSGAEEEFGEALRRSRENDKPARRLYGYEPEEVAGKANAAILHTPEDVRAGKPRAIYHRSEAAQTR